MEGFFVVFVLLSFVIPIAVIGSQRAKRTPISYGPAPAPAPEPTPASALSGWEAPAEAEAVASAALGGPVVGGHPVTCGHCGGVDFDTREAQLNTAMATFFNVDWANRAATCFVCLRCGHIEWFLF